MASKSNLDYLRQYLERKTILSFALPQALKLLEKGEFIIEINDKLTSK